MPGRTSWVNSLINIYYAHRFLINILMDERHVRNNDCVHESNAKDEQF